MKITCYDIISLTRKELELQKCPCCHTTLETSAVEQSQAAQAFVKQAAQPVITTHRFNCPYCGWWAVRELRADDALYHPPVEEFIVMDVSKPIDAKPAAPAAGPLDAPWEKVLSDRLCWANAEIIPSKVAVQLFGSAQMLLPKFSSPSGTSLFARLKSYAPILYPILIIGLAWYFF
ncbi:MAG: hypothetical protein R8K50_01005 [Mariprofundus sp.]